MSSSNAVRNRIDSLLKSYNLRSTNCRNEILSLFLNQDFALSHGDIEKEVSAHDRVTVYRTLKTFLDKGMIHKVLDDGASAKYALCRDCKSEAHHSHNHIHFKCVRCEATLCLDGLDIPNIALPLGYQYIEADLLVQGVCKSCS